MRILPFVFFTLVFNFIQNISGFKINECSAQASKVIFEIEQDGKLIRSIDNAFYLKKSPFTIRISMIKTNGVFINTSFSRYYYDLPDNTFIEQLEAKVLPEIGENAEKEIYTDTVGFHYWCYCPVERPPYYFNKFNTLNIVGDTIFGERIVENYFAEKDYKIENITSEIYILILLDENDTESPVNRLSRQKYIIRWK
jgi:hypothetical protein